MLLYLFIFTVAIVILFWYVFLYYRRYNKILKNQNLKLFKLSPIVFSQYLLFLSVFLGFGISIVNVNALSKEIYNMENHSITSRYIDGDYGSPYLEYVYENFNTYFGGSYTENGKIVLCVRNDAPSDLINYLDNNNVLYVFVKFNYSDLLQLRQLIAGSVSEIDGSFFVGTNEQSNKVIISAQNVEQVENIFQTYIDEGILEVTHGGQIDYQMGD